MIPKIYPKKNLGQTASIMVLDANFGGRHYSYSTGIKIGNEDLEKYWKDGRIRDCKETRVKQTKPDGRTFTLLGLNDGFDKVKKVAYSAWEETQKWQDIRDALDRHFGKSVAEKEKPVSGFYELLDVLCNGVQKKGRDLKKNSLGNYKFLRSTLKRYDKGKNLTFEDWTILQWNRFRSWMETNSKRKEKGEGISANSIMIICRTLKAFLNYAVKHKLTKTAEHRDEDFTAHEKKVNKIFLTSDEIEKLYRSKKIVDDEMKLIVAYFCAACECGGLRISDWHKMNPDNYVDNNKFLQVIPKKTEDHDTEVRIYLTPLFKEIMQNYGGRLPTMPNESTLRKGLKKACKLAGIERASEVTPHSARRSYICNMILKGMSTTVIKTVSGHRSESAFNRYVRIGAIESGKLQEQHAQKIKMGKLRAV